LSERERKLILVKHAMPEIVPGRPPSSWLLSEAGMKSCRPLAERLREHGPEIIVTSTEPKANETGLRVSSALGIPFESAPDLHETLRDTVAFHDNPDEWQVSISRFFDHPDELVLGEETAEQATQRFTAAVDVVLARHPEQTIAIVCHGTVISLYVARMSGIDPFPLWQRLGLPAFVVLSRPQGDILEVVDEIS
jgi:broad specificity phosphatase PhoE